ncbi:MAG TPA: transcription elongation factor GreA [Candidatus Pygmaiobacter gallistercoris]|nr:transcription elongation factor GreA [Candidatus Pygmaiobacter gallistercoris]
MVNNKEMVVTPEGLKALEDELEELKTVKRMEVAEKIKVARGFGDLSENSEYDEAKNEQGLIESRIIFLEKMLKNVRVLDHSELNNETVMVGCRVKVRDEDGEEEEYSIVGSTEADPTEGKISDESAVGKGLIGKRVGEVAEITVPSGAVVRYEVLEISTGN